MPKKQKLILIGLIILLASFFRFHQIQERAPFLGDQGRDLLEVRESLLAGKIPLTGTPTSQGINTGPAYYYLIIPALILTRFHPLGPILFFSSMGVFTTLLIFLLSRKLFGLIPALISALVYATSPLVIQRTLGIWSPIPVPLLSVLILFSLYQIQEKNQLSWFPILGFLVGIVIQFHPSAYFIFLLILGWWFYFVTQKSTKNNRWTVSKWSIIGSLSFFLALLPFLIFQVQNDLVDFKKITLVLFEKFLVGGHQYQYQAPLWEKFLNLFSAQFQALSLSKSIFFNTILGIILVISSLFLKKKSLRFWTILLLVWFIGGLLMLTFYPANIHAHYASFVWILPFFFLSSFLAKLEKLLPTKIIIFLGTCFIFLQVRSYFINFTAANDIQQTELTTSFIARKTKNQPFALLLDSPYSPSDAHLRYFLVLKQAPLKKIEDLKTKTLVFVCDHEGCFDAKTLRNKIFIDSQCLPECPPLEQQKKISLKNWRLIDSQQILRQKIYFFQKNN